MGRLSIVGSRTALVIALTLVLAACGGQPAAPPLPEPPVEAPAAEEPASPVEPASEPTAEQPAAEEPEPEAAASAGSGVLVFEIVPGESAASYEVGEIFLNQNNRFNSAVGVTPEVSGSVTVDLDDPRNSVISTITIDISQFKSDEPRRDARIQREWLESTRFPLAILEPTGLEGLPESYTPGEVLNFRVTGDLTVRDVTAPTTWDVTALVEGNTLRGTATTNILMTDFGFQPPTIAGILTVDDDVRLSLEFVAQGG
jgi:polyisoprenoid-binding protein YceI